MWTRPLKSPVNLQLPLMYAAPNRTLAYAYAYADGLDKFDRLRLAAEEQGIAVSLLYTYAEPIGNRFFGTLVLDFTRAWIDVAQAVEKLGRLEGIEMFDIATPGRGLAAWRDHELQVAGAPVVVISRNFIGETYHYLVEALGEQVETALYGAGVDAGRQIAERVPPLLTRLGVPLSTEFVQERVRDLEVFGWAEIVSLQMDDNLAGEALLSNDFEALAWQGQASTPRCNWLRGFIMGALASLGRKPITVTETECQAKGDTYCRMVFQPAGSRDTSEVHP
ncbi:MAG: hypothetical protein EPO21_12565 [Chloroflexota bacterium]|nr:MAG: hypothetical protein EPO21_12565 [Chloroflexota bacterium]